MPIEKLPEPLLIINRDHRRQVLADFASLTDTSRSPPMVNERQEVQVQRLKSLHRRTRGLPRTEAIKV
jgi:hypothetical protein